MYYLMGKINLLLENFNNEQNYVWVFSWEVISCKLSFPEVWRYWWQLLFSGVFSTNGPTYILLRWSGERTSVEGPRTERGIINISPWYPLTPTPVPRSHRGDLVMEEKLQVKEGLDFTAPDDLRGCRRSRCHSKSLFLHLAQLPNTCSFHLKNPSHQSISSRRPLVKCTC